MPIEGLRRLALADLDEETLRGLIEQGEHLLVERKQEPPEESGLGEAVSSFANTIGGWLLLGIANDGSSVGWKPPGRADAQAHLGEPPSRPGRPTAAVRRWRARIRQQADRRRACVRVGGHAAHRQADGWRLRSDVEREGTCSRPGASTRGSRAEAKRRGSGP